MGAKSRFEPRHGHLIKLDEFLKSWLIGQDRARGQAQGLASPGSNFNQVAFPKRNDAFNRHLQGRFKIRIISLLFLLLNQLQESVECTLFP